MMKRTLLVLAIFTYTLLVQAQEATSNTASTSVQHCDALAHYAPNKHKQPVTDDANTTKKPDICAIIEDKIDEVKERIEAFSKNMGDHSPRVAVVQSFRAAVKCYEDLLKAAKCPVPDD